MPLVWATPSSESRATSRHNSEIRGQYPHFLRSSRLRPWTWRAGRSRTTPTHTVDDTWWRGSFRWYCQHHDGRHVCRPYGSEYARPPEHSRTPCTNGSDNPRWCPLNSLGGRGGRSVSGALCGTKPATRAARSRTRRRGHTIPKRWERRCPWCPRWEAGGHRGAHLRPDCLPQEASHSIANMQEWRSGLPVHRRRPRLRVMNRGSARIPRALGACSSADKSIGLRNRGSWVRIPPGAPPSPSPDGR